MDNPKWPVKRKINVLLNSTVVEDDPHLIGRVKSRIRKLRKTLVELDFKIKEASTNQLVALYKKTAAKADEEIDACNKQLEDLACKS